MLTMLQYPVGIKEFTVPMHEGAAVLSVAMQNGKPYLWALSDKTAPIVPHLFYTMPTGEDAPDVVGDFIFVGTFQSPSGSLSFSLFDAGEEGEDDGEEAGG